MIDEPLKPLSILGLKRVYATLGGLHKYKKLTRCSGQFQSFCGAAGIRTRVQTHAQ